MIKASEESDLGECTDLSTLGFDKLKMTDVFLFLKELGPMTSQKGTANVIG